MLSTEYRSPFALAAESERDHFDVLTVSTRPSAVIRTRGVEWISCHAPHLDDDSLRARLLCTSHRRSDVVVAERHSIVCM
jgi:hypothetical protein